MFEMIASLDLINNLNKKIKLGILNIFIPTYNSESYIDIIIDYYKYLNLNVTFGLDAKSNDRTFDILNSSGVNFLLFNNKHKFIEPIIREIALSSGAKWLLRLDDDELPSHEMLGFIDSILSRDDFHSVYFHRKQCAINNAGLLYESKLFSTREHFQCRLNNVCNVEYTNSIHTPGFIPNPNTTISAPLGSFMIHLDWAINSYQKRLSKVNRYDEVLKGAGSFFKDYYLYEDILEPNTLCFNRLPNDEFKCVSLQIKNRFPNNCINLS